MSIFWKIAAIIISSFFAYKFYKPFLQSTELKKLILNGISILLPVAFIISLGIFLMEPEQPTSFKEGVELLQNDKGILDKIGGYSSHSWKESELPKETDNPARFKVSLKGTHAKIYLTCEVQKGPSGKWVLSSVKQDSLRIEQ